MQLRLSCIFKKQNLLLKEAGALSLGLALGWLVCRRMYQLQAGVLLSPKDGGAVRPGLGPGLAVWQGGGAQLRQAAARCSWLAWVRYPPLDFSPNEGNLISVTNELQPWVIN